MYLIVEGGQLQRGGGVNKDLKKGVSKRGGWKIFLTNVKNTQRRMKMKEFRDISQKR